MGTGQMGIKELFEALVEDPWRAEVGFTPELRDANEALFSAASSEAAERSLGAWLQKHQPCLFGRVAAKRGFEHYCVLNESDLQLPDEQIRSKIQAARMEWRRRALRGMASGFIVIAVSHKIATALPDDNLKALARRLCSLYLLAEVQEDSIVHDDLWLEVAGQGESHILHWRAGVNYFGAQGDRRWWRDHRLPGGLGFSTNSVGHMVKSSVLTKGLAQLHDILGIEKDELRAAMIDSLPKALEFAMRTIEIASTEPFGRGTWLKDAAEGEQRCPVELPEAFAAKSHCEYGGWYHTDVTIPSCYFQRDVERPANIEELKLDFTYLFNESVENPDFYMMGAGVQIRSDGTTTTGTPVDRVAWKRTLGAPQVLTREEAELVRQQLGLHIGR